MITLPWRLSRKHKGQIAGSLVHALRSDQQGSWVLMFLKKQAQDSEHFYSGFLFSYIEVESYNRQWFQPVGFIKYFFNVEADKKIMYSREFYVPKGVPGLRIFFLFYSCKTLNMKDISFWQSFPFLTLNCIEIINKT